MKAKVQKMIRGLREMAGNYLPITERMCEASLEIEMYGEVIPKTAAELGGIISDCHSIVEGIKEVLKEGGYDA